jgi:hypothetical protein
MNIITLYTCFFHSNCVFSSTTRSDHSCFFKSSTLHLLRCVGIWRCIVLFCWPERKPEGNVLLLAEEAQVLRKRIYVPALPTAISRSLLAEWQTKRCCCRSSGRTRLGGARPSYVCWPRRIRESCSVVECPMRNLATIRLPLLSRWDPNSRMGCILRPRDLNLCSLRHLLIIRMWVT